MCAFNLYCSIHDSLEVPCTREQSPSSPGLKDLPAGSLTTHLTVTIQQIRKKPNTRYSTMRLTSLLLVLLATLSQLAVMAATLDDVIVLVEQEQNQQEEYVGDEDGGVSSSTRRSSLRALGGTKNGGTTNKKSCPAVSPVLSGGAMTCSSKGKTCSFEYESTFPGAICKNKDDCTCSNQGKWVCASHIGCVDDAPVYIKKCPAVSPVVSKIASCLDNSKQQLCEYKYNTPMPKIPEGTCAHKDACTCNSQWQWDCQIDTKCSIPYDRP
jgi:hypothetical protein